MCCDRPPKSLAADIGYSVNSIYGALSGERSIPAKARRKLSQVNFIAAATVALEATGFTKLFGYQKVDRHIHYKQSVPAENKASDDPTQFGTEIFPEEEIPF